MVKFEAKQEFLLVIEDSQSRMALLTCFWDKRNGENMLTLRHKFSYSFVCCWFFFLPLVFEIYVVDVGRIIVIAVVVTFSLAALAWGMSILVCKGPTKPRRY